MDIKTRWFEIEFKGESRKKRFKRMVREPTFWFLMFIAVLALLRATGWA